MGLIGDQLRTTAMSVDQVEASALSLEEERQRLQELVNSQAVVIQTQGERIVILEEELEECRNPDPDPDPIPDPDPEPEPDPDPEPPPTADVVFDKANPYTAAKISNEPAGTVFLFVGPMTLNKAAIPTKANNVYLAIGGVKLDGQNSTPLAFLDSKSQGWMAEGFEITGYTCLNGAGVANKEGSAAIILRTGCKLRLSHVHHNKYSGVRFDGSNNHVYKCELDNNHSEGFCGTSNGGSIRESNIHHNGDAVGTTGLGNNRGGCKMVHSTNFTYELNWVHHNFWNGLWSDINNIGMKYFWNIIEFNEGSGIFHEVSFACEIAHNTFRDNGINRKIMANNVYPTKAQIEISNSPDAYVHDNQIFLSAGPLGYFGITALNSTHNQWTLGKMGAGRCLGVRNLRVENNTVVASGPEWIAIFAVTGNLPSSRSSDQNCGQKQITDPASNNKWANNTVTKSGGAYPSAPYILSGAHVSESAWAGKGYS